MEKVVKVRKEYRRKLAAITHYDGTGRLQTVNHEENKDLAGILIKFEKLTGFPILLNTSFNMNGEPMVNSPEDAIKTFLSCKLETMVIGNYLIKKK